MIKLIQQDITDGFQWKTTEQVYPFEKDSSGNTLYCKEINFGSLPNAGTKEVSHNISNFSYANVHRVVAKTNTGTNLFMHLNYSGGNGIILFVSNTAIRIDTGADRTTWSAIIHMIYTK